MKHVDEFRDTALGRRLVARIAEQVDAWRASPAAMGRAERPLRIMEVCGGHTHVIFRYGLTALLPADLKLVHGPGCPVCVLPVGRVDDAIALAQLPGVTFCSFGDALRVPGSRTSLLGAKALGADVRAVYSPADALALARQNPAREVIFFAIGFETTAPSTALVVEEASAQGIRNFSVFSNHVTIVPALAALLERPDQQIDGFIGPGHVSMVIGSGPYAGLAREHHKPVVITGFEPLDLLQAISLLLEQLTAGVARVDNQYRRVVRDAGNPVAQAALARAFEPRGFEWRGLGAIPGSGLALAPRYSDLDAERRFGVPGARVSDHRACRCGEVLVGALEPWQCQVFGSACTPSRPLGACMVSSEGACAAYFNYGRASLASQHGAAS